SITHGPAISASPPSPIVTSSIVTVSIIVFPSPTTDDRPPTTGDAPVTAPDPVLAALAQYLMLLTILQTRCLGGWSVVGRRSSVAAKRRRTRSRSSGVSTLTASCSVK